MPELPEAETIVRGLRASVLRQTIRRVEVVRPDILRQPKADFLRRVRGRRIESVGRRGKKVLIGTLDEIRLQFPDVDADADLETLFMRATGADQ